MKAKTSLHNGNPSPSEVKAWGLYQAIAWIHDLGYHNVIFEVDSKMVTNSFNNKVDVLFQFHVILSNCRDKIQNITNSRVSFERRQTNHVAHKLARASRFNACNVFDYIPTCIHSLLVQIHSLLPLYTTSSSFLVSTNGIDITNFTSSSWRIA